MRLEADWTPLENLVSRDLFKSEIGAWATAELRGDPAAGARRMMGATYCASTSTSTS